MIEDEAHLVQTITSSLERDLFVVETAVEYDSALEKMLVYDYDCILLDIMLPNGSGLELLKKVKQAGKSANIIIISAKDAVEDKIDGLDFGADDYLTKPFHLAELRARIKAVIRRKQLGGQQLIRMGNVEVLLTERTVSVAHQVGNFNRKEYDVLVYLLVNKNRLVTKHALAEQVWGDNADQANNFDFVYYQIKNLRKKLHDYGAHLEIEAVYGIGYKLIEK